MFWFDCLSKDFSLTLLPFWDVVEIYAGWIYYLRSELALLVRIASIADITGL